MSRLFLAAFLSVIAGATAGAAPPDQSAPDMLETVDQVYASAVRQAIGAPARADLGGQATARLGDNQLIVPKDPAARLLTLTGHRVPPEFVALLLGADGMDAPGLIRFVPAGFVRADEALSWSPDDMLASLNNSVERANPVRLMANEQTREARRWIASPRYDPETHQLSWAALILPKGAPRGSEGAITYHAVGFGREGYIELSVVTSVQKAEQTGRLVDSFLGGLNFVSGKAYSDTQPTDRRSSAGLAGAMGLDSLHKAEADTNFWSSDSVIPMVGTIVAGIGAISLVIYIHRHMRSLRRRV